MIIVGWNFSLRKVLFFFKWHESPEHFLSLLTDTSHTCIIQLVIIICIVINLLVITVLYNQIYSTGLDTQIQEIKESVELPLTHPEYYEEMGIKPPKGVILYGQPGTGKTLLAKAVANQTSATFLRVVGSELIQKYLVCNIWSLWYTVILI